jgi:HPt (histidine-containing phosphotransfer) domain-containing protein
VEARRLLDEMRTLTSGAAAEAPRAAAAPAAPASAAGTAEIVNAETLTHLEDLGSTPDFLERLVGVFVADSLSLLAKMEAAVGARNFGEFRSHLHAMKGSAASIGTERLTRLCASLSKYTDAELRLQASGLMRSLGEEFQLGRAALERHMKDKRSSSVS